MSHPLLAMQLKTLWYNDSLEGQVDLTIVFGFYKECLSIIEYWKEGRLVSVFFFLNGSLISQLGLVIAFEMSFSFLEITLKAAMRRLEVLSSEVG